MFDKELKDQPKQLLIVGNKRSGTTHLMKLLNLHPNVFMSNESDINWLLFLLFNDRAIVPYKWDEPKGMNETLKHFKHLVVKEKTPLEKFIEIQTSIMKKGIFSLKPMNKQILRYIGDQKPTQNIDPEILPFIMENFKNSKFIHLIRHPFSVVQSNKSFARNTGGEIWGGKTDTELVERWLLHEKWVADAKKKYNIDMIDVRYEDIIFRNKETMKGIYNFLEIPVSGEILDEGKSMTTLNVKFRKEIPVSDEVINIMKQYNYRRKNILLNSRSIANIINKVLKQF